jgi:scyllo-inositol 2-dehydrogenase (NADP+)
MLSTVGILFALTCCSSAQTAKTRIAIVGLDHDHVWELLQYIAVEPQAELVAIVDNHQDLIEKARTQVPTTVKFFPGYVEMLDLMKPEAVFVTTETDKHLDILRECAKRHINYSTEKPMATNAADALTMEQLAETGEIKLMVNYWNAWTASTRELFHRVKSGEIGTVKKIIVQYGHQGPKEIGISKEFGDWLYDPVKNGGGAIMDFGCYGAEMALLLRGRPMRVYATTRKLKADQHNKVDDEATILLDYPDATTVIEPSWDWSYSMDRTYVFGSKGSLLSTRSDLFERVASDQGTPATPDGARLALGPVPHEMSNPIAYMIDCIRNNKPVEEPLSGKLNVQVMEILDAARESVRTGRAVDLR